MEKIILGDNIPEIIKILGVEGAQAGLQASKIYNLTVLKGIADNLGVKYQKKSTKKEIIKALFTYFDKRITKTFSEMKNMNYEDLLQYLKLVNCNRTELIALLEENNIPYKKTDSFNALMNHAAREISTLGVYQRIAGSNDFKGAI